MSFGPRLLGFLLLSLPVAACGSSSDHAAASSERPTAAGTSIDAGAPSLSIAFTEPDLSTVPGKSNSVAVQVTPAGEYVVRFALVGDARDAYLDRSAVRTADDGTASVELTAPSSAATFTVRASIGAVSADLSASAGDGFASLQVEPQYAGNRAVSTWVATVRTGGPSCDSLLGVPPPDGPLAAQADANNAPIVKGVPVGTALTVTLRAGHFAGGCTELAGVVAGQANTVQVTVVDRPLQMGSVNVDVNLGLDRTADVANAWQSLGTNIANSFVDGAASDASALLDAMQDATPAVSQDLFIQARQTNRWDSVLDAALDQKLGQNGVRGTVSDWITDALPTLSKGLVTGTLSSTGAVLGSAVIDVSSVGGLPPAAVSAPASLSVSWSPQSGDQVLFGGVLSLAPSSLATALAASSAAKASPGATSVPSALAALTCGTTVTTLVGSSATDAAYFECDSSCILARCQAALTAMWGRAVASTGTTTPLVVAASGAARVDDGAAPDGFTGTWVGSLSFGTLLPTRVGGSAIGGGTSPILQ
jgi:hypothetical protein